MQESSKFNIRYAGFESLVDGGRRLHYAITAPGTPARSAGIHIPAAAFTGTDRITFQESATIGCERIRRELESQSEPQNSMMFSLTPEDIVQLRPRRRAAGKRS